MNISEVIKEFGDCDWLRAVLNGFSVDAILFSIYRARKLEEFIRDNCKYYGGDCGDGEKCPCDNFKAKEDCEHDWLRIDGFLSVLICNKCDKLSTPDIESLKKLKLDCQDKPGNDDGNG